MIFQQPTSTPPTARAAPGPASSAAPTQSATPTPTPTPTGPPCPASTPCTVPGDAGNALAAITAFRAAHGAPAVPGTVSDQAAQCALSQGDGATCRPHYAWETVPTQDGNAVVASLGSRDAGWLLDPAMTSFSVGWSYTPGNGGQWSCAVLKVG